MEQHSAQQRQPNENATSESHRGNWSSGIEFLLSCISISIGLGNVWRFPNLAYENGGGAFLIPYFTILFIVSKPLYYMELALGQFSGKGPVKVWSCVPGFKGIGFAQALSTFLLMIFYNFIMAISLFYMFASMQTTLPWTVCDPAWADNATCFVKGANISNVSNNLVMNPAPKEYFEKYVLHDSGSLDNISFLDWRLVLCLLLSWTIVAVSTVKGVRSVGKVVYITASYPYIVIIALLCVSLTMEGSLVGLKYFLTPQWSKLADVKVWYKACEQSFFSLNIGFGHLIMYASYNKFNHPVHRDALIISVADTLTSVLAGMVVFSVLGVLARDLKVDVSEVVKDSGLRLAFVAYPEALGRLSVIPQLWSVLFFIMLYILGLGSSIGHVEAIMTTIKDEIPILQKWKSAGAIGCCIICFLCGLPLTSNSGQYIMQLLDNYGVGAAVFFYGILEMVGISWIYGWRNFCNDVEFMLKTKINVFWKATWSYIAPTVLIAIYLYGTFDLIFNGGTSTGVVLPAWGIAIGWIFATICISQILIWFIVVMWKSTEKGVCNKVRYVFRPKANWGPIDAEDKAKWLLWKKEKNKQHCSCWKSLRYRKKEKHTSSLSISYETQQYENIAFEQ